LSRLGECGLPLYKLLKKSDSFRWMDETQRVLGDLKTLLLFVTTTTQVISAALVVEREEPGYVYKVQRSIYYISKVHYKCETRCSQVQKLLYIILITRRKLLHYFESHPFHVVTSLGLREVVENHVATGRITQ
jgi:hypothetical protein